MKGDPLDWWNDDQAEVCWCEITDRDDIGIDLIAPYERDPRTWTRIPWIDRGSGARIRITTTGETGGPGVARVKTYRDVIAEFRHHPEAKSADAKGVPSHRSTVGLLHRRHVVVNSLAQVGKESNMTEQINC